MLAGRESEFELLDGFSYDPSERYFVTGNGIDYILDLTFSEDKELEVRIKSTDRKTIEKEIERAKVLIDDVVRFERNRRKVLQ